MINPEARRSNQRPIVFGGNVNDTLRTWLRQIGVEDFVHADFKVDSIEPLAIEKSAEYVRRTYVGMGPFLTVGKFADKLLTRAFMLHGSLPATTTTDKKVIAESLENCRNYLLRSIFYAPTNI